MGRTETPEVEIKFEAAHDLALPDLRSFVGRTVRLPEEQLTTLYIDTADRRLWRAGLTLRHRTRGQSADGTWTLKLPDAGQGDALERTEVSWPGRRPEVPGDARAVLAGVVRREPLRPLVVLETTRQRLALRGDEDQPLAELDDDRVLVVGGQRDGLQFRQLELESLDDEWTGSDAVVSLLEDAGARVESAPKLAKATELPMLPPRGPHHGTRATAGDVVQASLRSGLERLVAHDWRIRLASPQAGPHDIHQARVATRRLRSDLKTFAPLLDPVWTTHVRDDLKWLGAAFGDVRDVDVLVAELADAPPVLLGRLATQRADAVRRLAAVMESSRYLDLLDKVHAGAERLPLASDGRSLGGRPAREVLPSLVRKQWRGLRRTVRRAGPAPTAAELHKIRIKAKQVRYAAEASVATLGTPAKRTAAAAEDVQTILGEHHDAVTREAWVRRALTSLTAADSSGRIVATAFESGRLVAEAHERQRTTEARWGDAWKRLSKRKRRRWLRTSSR